MEKENKKLSPGKLAVAIAAVVVLVAALIALVLVGRNKQAETTVPEETVVYTIPADGNPNDETAKGTYTAADDVVLAARDTVVARMGEYTLTNGQLQVYYWLQVQDFLNNYGAYAEYFGLDYTKPLDKQTCMVAENGCTWQQFFLAGALNTWKNYQAMCVEAEKAGFEMPADAQATLDNLEQSVAQDAAMYGMASTEEYLAAVVGRGATMEDFASHVRQSYQGTLYFEGLCQQNQPSEEEVESYFTQHEADYAANGLTRDNKYVNVRHALIMPEGADSSNIRTETFDDAAWAASEAKAQELLAQFEAGDKSEESFAALAIEHSQDSSAVDGGLFEDVTKGQMVESFENWCFDAARKPGDYGLVKTEFGYHLMYYVSDRPAWKEIVRQEMVAQISNDLLNGILENYTMEAEFDKISLAFVNLGGKVVEEEAAAEPQTTPEESRTPLLILAGVCTAGLAAAAYVFQKKEEEL